MFSLEDFPPTGEKRDRASAAPLAQVGRTTRHPIQEVERSQGELRKDVPCGDGSISCALSIIEAEVASRELFGPSKKSSKNCQSSNGSSSSSYLIDGGLLLR